MNENEIVTMEEISGSEEQPDLEKALEETVLAKNEAEARCRCLEAMLCCMENGVDPANAEDVILLAEKTDSDIRKAIPAVLEKYPFFTASTKAEPITTGVHIPPSLSKSTGGVEAAFRKANPDVKF